MYMQAVAEKERKDIIAKRTALELEVNEITESVQTDKEGHKALEKGQCALYKEYIV
jgi:hypothetical protein